jgi:glyoxylase-like metal-dependent hydrolase (beta-lactamase superfamily II)
MRARTLSLGVCLCLAVAAGAAGAGPSDARPAPRRLQVADGVFVFLTPPYGDVGLDGNSVAVISDEGVLVFDSNATPAAAEAVLTEIRALTDRPVRYVVSSHWHWDHWYGTEVYAREFPGLTVIAHEATRRMMRGPALEFNRPGLEEQLPAYLDALERRLAAAATARPDAPETAQLRRRVEDARFFLEQKRGVRHVLPGLTFSDRLTVHLGGREIQVRHPGRAVTPGDAYLYMPRERLLVTGDLLVNPVSFALSCYPSGWLAALDGLDALDAEVIVPGHGEPLRDETLLHATQQVFRELLRQGRDAFGRGVDVDAAAAAILPSLDAPRRTITRDQPSLNEAFRVQLVDWFLHRVYEEAAGPLDDTIARIPER